MTARRPKPCDGVVGRLLEPAIVEHQHLGLAVFEEQFAVVGAVEAVREVAVGDGVAIEPGAVDQRGNELDTDGVLPRSNR